MKKNEFFLRKLNRQQLKKSSLKIEKLIKNFIKYNIEIITKINSKQLKLIEK